MKSRSNHALRQAAGHASRVVAVALDLALIGALAVACAYATWVWFTPRVKGAPPSAVENHAHEAPSPAAQRLFAGDAMPRAAGTTALRLIGVAAPARALFIAENGRPRTAAVGDSIGGLELVEVHPDHVVVSRGGTRERIALIRGNVGR
jgi:hypothetical protein